MPNQVPPKTASLRYERVFLRAGFRYIIGIDEAGRGPWAGPLVSAAVCLPVQEKDLRTCLLGVQDSKMMAARQRDELQIKIKEVALTWGIGTASTDEINKYRLSHALHLTMQRALEQALAKVNFEPDILLLDYIRWHEQTRYETRSLVKGDRKSLSIAAASVLAKTYRDQQMEAYDLQYPEYGFAQHKGYGTKQHRHALEKFGVSPIHRTYYKPIQAIVAQHAQA